MSRQASVLVVVLIALGASHGRVQAQDKPTPSEAPKAEAAAEAKVAAEARARTDRPADKFTATLRVQLVINRFQGEKKVGSLPYAFTLTAGAERLRMRMGVDTPIPTNVSGPPGATSFQYKNVGTNIDCHAKDLGGGRYLLSLTVENSSALPLEKGPGVRDRKPDAVMGEAPLFRRFDVQISPVLRDGETIQTVASTDPVTGEVVKIDLTMNVVK